jgi:hypothetical protein
MEGTIMSEKPIRSMRRTGSPVARATARFKQAWFMEFSPLRCEFVQTMSRRIELSLTGRSTVRWAEPMLLEPLLLRSQGLAAPIKRS